MRSKWNAYSLAIWVAGFVLLAQGFIELLKPVVIEGIDNTWVKDNASGLLFVFFAIVVLIMAWIFRGEEHP